MVNLQVATYNVRGLRDPMKRRKIFNMLHTSPHDIVMLQETHSTKAKEKIWKSEWGGTIIFNHGELNSRGVAILIKRNIDVHIGDVKRDLEGRILLVAAKIQDLKMAIINFRDLLLCQLIYNKILALTRPMEARRRKYSNSSNESGYIITHCKFIL